MALSGSEIVGEAAERTERFGPDIARWNMLLSIYHDRWRELYPGEFRAGVIEKTANFIKRSWRLFSVLVGKVPDKRVQALSLAQTQRDRSDQLEKVCFGYDDIWRMRRKMREVGFYFAGLGAFGVGVYPDPVRGFPMLAVEDPRNCLPGPASDATNVAQASANLAYADPGGTLRDMIVRRSLTGAQLRRMFPEARGLVDNDAAALRARHLVLHHADEESQTTVHAPSGEILAQAPHGLDHCPWHFPTIFAPDRGAGESIFEGSIGINLAFVRMLDQKLELNDAVTQPWMFTRGAVQVFPNERRIHGITPDSAAQMLSPPAEFQMDRDMALMRDLLRLFNFETEASQGAVGGGPVTGRGLVELSRPTTEIVQSFFDDLADVLPRLYTDALLLDRAHFGGAQKDLAGWGRGETFQTSYDPAELIGAKGFGRISVEFGPGLGGFEGHLELLQDLGAEAISVETVMEWNRNIPSVSNEQRRVFLEKAKLVIREKGFAGELGVDLGWMAKLVTAVEGGKDPYAWIAANPPTPPAPPEPAAAAPGAMVTPPELGALLGGRAPAPALPAPT